MTAIIQGTLNGLIHGKFHVMILENGDKNEKYYLFCNALKQDKSSDRLISRT